MAQAEIRTFSTFHVTLELHMADSLSLTVQAVGIRPSSILFEATSVLSTHQHLVIRVAALCRLTHSALLKASTQSSTNNK